MRVPADDPAGPNAGAAPRPDPVVARAADEAAGRPGDVPNGETGGPPADPVRVALELPRLTVTRMAAELGIPRATLEAYRLGTRRMPVAVRTRLAHYLVEHARALRELAALLDQS